MNNDEPLFTLKQFLALAKHVDEQNQERSKDIDTLDGVNAQLHDKYDAVNVQLRGLVEENNVLRQQLIALKQELSFKQDDLRPEAKWELIEQALFTYDGLFTNANFYAPNKIGAIKKHRELFKCGLKDSKEHVEDMFFCQDDITKLKEKYMVKWEHISKLRA